MLFSFDLYDRDGSGELEMKEIETMVNEVYGDPTYKNNQHAMHIISVLEEEIDRNSQIRISIDDFAGFARKHQALLMPAFNMQPRKY